MVTLIIGTIGLAIALSLIRSHLRKLSGLRQMPAWLAPYLTREQRDRLTGSHRRPSWTVITWPSSRGAWLREIGLWAAVAIGAYVLGIVLRLVIA